MKQLKMTMLLNALSCIAFGLLFLTHGTAVDEVIGNTFAWVMPVVGGILLLNGVHLLLAARRTTPLCLEVAYFIVGDFAWVIGSLVLIMLNLVITTREGIVLSLLIAVMVAIFGFMQLFAYKRICTQGQS